MCNKLGQVLAYTKKTVVFVCAAVRTVTIARLRLDGLHKTLLPAGPSSRAI